MLQSLSSCFMVFMIVLSSVYHCDHLTVGTLCWLSACVSTFCDCIFYYSSLDAGGGLLFLIVTHPGALSFV